MLTSYATETHLISRFRYPSTGKRLRPSLHLAMLLDTSGSMNGERINAVKRTLQSILPLLLKTDHVTLVSFNSSAQILAHYQTPENLITVIQNLHCEGNTNLEEGFLKLIEASKDVEPYDAVLLLTDGQINDGCYNTAGLNIIADAVPGRWRAFYCIGYGSSHNRQLLRQLAMRTHGSYIYIQAETDLPASMSTLLTGLREEVLANVVLSSVNGWASQEITSYGAKDHNLGCIQADKDYWVVWEKQQPESSRYLSVSWSASTLDSAGGGAANVRAYVLCADVLPEDFRVQLIRVRAVKLLKEAADALETGQPVSHELYDLARELSQMNSTNPLILRLRADIAAVIDSVNSNPTSIALMATASASAAYYATQRGCSGDPTDIYSTPLQRQVSNSTQDVYNS